MERQYNIDSVVAAMRDAIASSNWEFTRLALISRKQYKADAWARLTLQEWQQLEALVPVEIELLKAALVKGAIAAYKEDSEGGTFCIQTDANCEPKLMSGTTVRNFYGIL